MSRIPFLFDTDRLVGTDVEVYFNLHKNCFSIKARKTGRVIGHADWIALEDVTFHVSEAGRLRVLRERKKNVHATVRGTVTTVAALDAARHNDPSLASVSYNPYQGPYFVDRLSHVPIGSAASARLSVWTEDGVTKGKIFATGARALDISAAA